MADGEHQVGAVHRIEVQLLDAVVDEVDHLLGADGGGDEAAGGGIVLEAVEPVGEPAAARSPPPGGRNWPSA